MAERMFGSLAPYPEVLAKARGFFDEQPGWNYGDVLPLARGPEGQLRPAIPQALRSAAQGYIDAVAGTQTGDLTPQATETLMFGSLVPGGPGMASGLGSVMSPIRAFHGSPHDFDRFDLSKIGTGEGAQAYGHGIYVAEKENVARAYDPSGGKLKIEIAPEVPDRVRNQAQSFDRFVGSTDDVRRTIEEDISELTELLSDESRLGSDAAKSIVQRDLRNRREFLQAIDEGAIKLSREGKVYEVNISADPGAFLDWDAQSQPAAVVDAFGRLGFTPAEGTTGGAMYKQLGDWLGRESSDLTPYGGNVDAMTSARLREMGVPGIRYLDQGSRSAGDGTRNMVVFDPELIDIIRKYGLSGLGFGSLVPATLQQPNSSAKGDRLRSLSPYEA